MNAFSWSWVGAYPRACVHALTRPASREVGFVRLTATGAWFSRPFSAVFVLFRMLSWTPAMPFCVLVCSQSDSVCPAAPERAMACLTAGRLEFSTPVAVPDVIKPASIIACS